MSAVKGKAARTNAADPTLVYEDNDQHGAACVTGDTKTEGICHLPNGKQGTSISTCEGGRWSAPECVGAVP